MSSTLKTSLLPLASALKTYQIETKSKLKILDLGLDSSIDVCIGYVNIGILNASVNDLEKRVKNLEQYIDTSIDVSLGDIDLGEIDFI